MKKILLFKFLIASLFFIILLIFPLFPTNPIASRMFAVVVLMAFFWLTETLPLGVTSLLPVILFPILGIDSTSKISGNYMNSTIFLFLGGFFLSIAMEKWNLHRRIALSILNLMGTSKYSIVFGFAAATALMSMFISNTATAMIMLPIALAIINKIEDNINSNQSRKFAIALLLVIAYSASIGGIATLIGTPPNLVLMRVYETTFSDLPRITFASWLFYGIPLSLGMMILMLLMVSIVFLRKVPSILLSKTEIKTQLLGLGKMQKSEIKILSVFFFIIFLWMFREPLQLDWFTIPGWGDALGLGKFVDDGTIGIFGAIILFLLPANFNDMSIRILNKESIKSVPWEIILLFGGGFALASGFESSGLSKEIAQQLEYMHNLPVFAIVLIIGALVTTLTEFSSNTATAATMLPVVAAMAQVMNINPLILMIPAAISASFAFTMPISTPPNAIVFSSGRLKIKDMLFAGILMNILGLIYIVLFFSIIN